jgi:hypothetical protein
VVKIPAETKQTDTYGMNGMTPLKPYLTEEKNIRHNSFTVSRSCQKNHNNIYLCTAVQRIQNAWVIYQHTHTIGRVKFARAISNGCSVRRLYRLRVAWHVNNFKYLQPTPRHLNSRYISTASASMANRTGPRGQYKMRQNSIPQTSQQHDYANLAVV